MESVSTAKREVMRTAVYARVSTVEQAQSGTSLATQIERCRSHVCLQGWRIVGEYVDEGVSGMIAQRPKLDALFAAVHADEVDVVVVLRLDRFARSMRRASRASISCIQIRGRNGGTGSGVSSRMKA